MRIILSNTINRSGDAIVLSLQGKVTLQMEVGHTGVTGLSAVSPVARAHSQGQDHAQTPPLRVEGQTVLEIALRRLIAT